MMESDSGAAIMDVRVRHGKRRSVFRSYVLPYMDWKNLTVLTRASTRCCGFIPSAAARLASIGLQTLERSKKRLFVPQR
jgi:hypothetical protein